MTEETSPPACELEELRNLGPASVRWLLAAGIADARELAALGPVAAFLRVKVAGGKPSLNLLYAIAGALEGVRWDRLSPERRAALLMELDAAENLSASSCTSA